MTALAKNCLFDFFIFRRRKNNRPDDSMAPVPLVESPGDKIKLNQNYCKLIIY